MNFADEEYVRLYVADTVTWRVLSWEAHCVLALALRKFDHAGVFEFGRHGAEKALTAAIGVPVEIVSKALPQLLEEQVWTLEDGRLFWPKYIEAQTCKRSDRLRKRMSRARVADVTGESKRDTESQSVDSRDNESRNVTGSHDSTHESQPVTVGHPLAGKGEGEAGQARDGEGSDSGSRESPPVQISLGARRFDASFDTIAPAAIEFTEEMKALSESSGIKLDDCWLECRDNRRAKNYKCGNWQAEFLSWLRREAKFKREREAKFNKPPPSEPVPPCRVVEVPETPEQYAERVKRECAKSLAYMARATKLEEAERARVAAIHQRRAAEGKAGPQ